MDNEVWAVIEEFPSYEVSTLGRVRVRVSHKIRKTRIDRDGYEIISLYDGTTNKNRRVHRLVAQAFIPNPCDYPCVNHRDENPQNNNVDNLEWCTVRYNCNYGSHNKKLSRSRIGMVNPMTGRKHSEETKKKMREAARIRNLRKQGGNADDCSDIGRSSS